MITTIHTKEDVMKFRDLFVPRYLHSNPEVRKKFASRCDDTYLLEQMSQKDESEMVCRAAAERLQELKLTRETI